MMLERIRSANPLARTWLIMAVAVASVGCGRNAYRLRADREAARIVAEKANDPRWAAPDFTVYPDRRSRFFDPYNPDRPPMPPDDPASHRFMHRIDGKRGSRNWHRDGDIQDVESPCWQVLLPSYTQFTEDGKLKLDLPTAVLLARLHNPDFQDNLEEIYLSALDVAFERFRFDVQFFGGSDTIFATRGNEPQATLGRTGPGVGGNSSSTLNQQSDLGFTKRFATGAELLVSFANSMVWQFSGDNTNFATSLVNFSLVQPLLRNGGRIVVLERLTRSERALLANLRAQAQFRTEFFKNIAVGGGTSVSPRRIGGFAGGAGLSGFTGTGEGGFGGVGAGQNFGGFGGRGVGTSGAGGGAGLAGGGEGVVGGFYGLVQQLQAIRNTEASLASQSLTLELLEANFEAGLIDLVQVDEFRQNIETERANLIRSQVALQDLTENYLINTLGLPPWLEIEIDDSVVKQFQLIEPTLTQEQSKANDLLRQTGRLPESPTTAALAGKYRDLLKVVDGAMLQLQRVREELTDLETRQGEIRARLVDATRRAEFDDVIPKLRASIVGVEGRLKSTADAAKAIERLLVPGKEIDALNQIVERSRSTSNLLEEVSLLQARIRVEKVNIDPIKLDVETAVEIARTHRLDWMNRRAALVDQWRLIAFNANALKSNVTIALDGDMGTIGDNPARFRAPTGTLRGRLIFDAPLNRKAERNVYRESLLDYQSAKRNYINYVDRVGLTLRSRLRQISRLENNLEIQRRALVIAIRRVDQTLEDLNRPFMPSAPGQPPAQLGPTLSQNLLRALSDLRNTQDNFMSVWLNHLAARMNLLFDLGILELDENGMWVDEPFDIAIGRALGRIHGSSHTDPCHAFLEKLDEAAALGRDAETVSAADPLEHLFDPLLESPTEVAEHGANGNGAWLTRKIPAPPDADRAGSLTAPSRLARSAAARSPSRDLMAIEVVDEAGQPLPQAAKTIESSAPQSHRAAASQVAASPLAPPAPVTTAVTRAGMPKGNANLPPHSPAVAERDSRSFVERAIDRLSGTASKAMESPKAKQEYAARLKRVKQLEREGKSFEQIQKALALDEPTTRALMKAARDAEEPVILEMATETKKVPVTR